MQADETARIRETCPLFELDKKVFELFMRSPMENLEDFRFYFTSEDQIDAFVSEDKELKEANLRIQVARTRRSGGCHRRSRLARSLRVGSKFGRGVWRCGQAWCRGVKLRPDLRRYDG